MSETETLASGLGLSALTLAPRAEPLLIHLNHTLYHQKDPVTSVVMGMLLSGMLLAMAYSFGVLGLSLLPDGWVKRLSIAFSVFAATQLSCHVLARVLEGKYVPRILQASAYSVLTVLLIIALRSASRFYGVISRLRFLLTGGVIFALVVVGQLARAAAVSYQLSRQPPRLAPAFTDPPTSPRVIWILFDELSYKQVFDSTPALGLHLPHFEALQHASVSFRNVTPAGYWTEEVVPSLFLGSVVKHVTAVTPRKVSIRIEGSAADVPFDPKATIFGDLRAAGLNTAIVGWSNPYCDLLAPVLTTCVWQSDIPVLGRMTSEGVSGSQTALENSLAILTRRLGALRPWVNRGSGIMPDVVERKRSYDALISAAICEIHDGTAALLFIHLPVPHPPGFYSRRLQAFSSSGTYLDNLALADQTLHVLLKAIAKSSTANATAVIVTSDHSWRIGLWKSAPQWSSEEASASAEGFDPRIPLLVHFPGQSQELDIDRPFRAVRTRSLIELMVGRTLSSPDSIEAWSKLP